MLADTKSNVRAFDKLFFMMFSLNVFLPSYENYTIKVLKYKIININHLNTYILVFVCPG
jgi:hypothetical protein